MLNQVNEQTRNIPQCSVLNCKERMKLTAVQISNVEMFLFI